MQVELHSIIVSIIKNHHGLSLDCMKQLTTRFPQLSYDTLFSILALEYQKRMKYNHRKTQCNKIKYWELYKRAVEVQEKPGIIVRMAKDFDIAPCLLAKLILNYYFDIANRIENVEHSEQYSNINIYLRDTSLIQDMNMSYEIFLCTLYDNLYSPLTETMRSSLGQQYEIKLYREAHNLGLAFRDEEHLRKHGYDKTPDCKLDVPVVVDGFIINWIESKALFGDEDAHREYKKNQYLSYWNRFGPGLVIYWFGYLETIVELNDKRFIIRDCLPKDVIHIAPPNFDMDDKTD